MVGPHQGRSFRQQPLADPDIHHGKRFGQDFIQSHAQLVIVFDLGKFFLPLRRLLAQVVIGQVA